MERYRKFFVLAWMWVFVPLLLIAGKPVPGANPNVSLFEVDGKVGLKDEAGQVLIPAVYEALGWSGSTLTVVDKVLGYRKEGRWGLIHTSNRIITEAEYTGLNPGEGSYLIATKTALSQRPAFGVITTSGRKAIPVIYDGLTISNMRAIVMVRSGHDYLFGLSDLDHRLLIPIAHRDIYSLGSLRYAVENTEGKTAIFSEDGVRLTAFDIDSLSSRNNYAIVYRNQRQGVMDRQGVMIIQPVYAEVRIEGGELHVREAHHWYLLKGNNERIGELRADRLFSLSAQHYGVVWGGLVQLSGNDLQPLQVRPFAEITPFQDGHAIFSGPRGKGVLTSTGEILLSPVYEQIAAEKQGYRVQMAPDRWSLRDQDGKEADDRTYAYIGPWNGSFFPVVNRGYWGAIAADGKQLISCVHDSIVQVAGNHVVVKFKGGYGVVDMDEHWIVTPTENRIELIGDGFYLEHGDPTTFLKTIPGRVIYFTDNPLTLTGDSLREHLPAGGYWIIDRAGVIVGRSTQPEGTERVFEEAEGFRAIRKDGKYGFIDQKGRLRIANRYEDVRAFHEGMAAIRIQDRWGFIDRQERLCVQPLYEEVQPFVRGLSVVSRKNQWGVVDKTGTLVLPLRYDAITRTASNRLRLKQGDHFGLADTDGSIITHPRYESIKETPDGYVIVGRGGRYGVITLDGVSTIPLTYDEIVYDAYRGHFLAMKKSAWRAVSP